LSRGMPGLQMGPRCGGTGAGVYGKSVRRRLSFSLARYSTVSQAETFAFLACVNDIKAHGTPEKHVSICSNSLVAMKALRTVITTSLLVRQCQEALNDISARHAVGLHWVPGHVSLRGNKTADGLTRNGSASGYVGPELALVVSRQYLRNKISRWVGNQHWRLWQNLGNTQWQTQELISGPSRGTEVRLLSFNRIQSRVVTGLLTRHNTLRRHLHLMRMTYSPQCRKCGAEDETFAHISVGVRCWPHLGMCI
jgi:ribonuclease HI